MKRKVNRVGQNTLTVSLPVQWVRKQGVKVGAELDVNEAGPNLIVSKELVQQEKTIDVHFTEESRRYIRSYIGRLYRYGYTTMRVAFDNPALIKSIKEATNNLIGADIIDLDKNKCLVKIFPIESDDYDIDKYLVKIFNALNYMFQVTKEDMKNNSFKREPALADLRNNTWKLKDYILRNAFLQKVPHEEFSILSNILFSYEKIGTNLLAFYRIYLEGTRKKINAKKLSHVFNKLDYFFDWFTKVVSKQEPIPYTQEAKFRREMRNFHIYLLNELHSDKAIDHPFLTIVYFTVELLDSTVSYLQVYKKEYEN